MLTSKILEGTSAKLSRALRKQNNCFHDITQVRNLTNNVSRRKGIFQASPWLEHCGFDVFCCRCVSWAVSQAICGNTELSKIKDDIGVVESHAPSRLKCFALLIIFAVWSANKTIDYTQIQKSKNMHVVSRPVPTTLTVRFIMKNYPYKPSCEADSHAAPDTCVNRVAIIFPLSQVGIKKRPPRKEAVSMPDIFPVMGRSAE